MSTLENKNTTISRSSTTGNITVGDYSGSPGYQSVHAPGSTIVPTAITLENASQETSGNLILESDFQESLKNVEPPHKVNLLNPLNWDWSRAGFGVLGLFLVCIFGLCYLIAKTSNPTETSTNTVPSLRADNSKFISSLSFTIQGAKNSALVVWNGSASTRLQFDTPIGTNIISVPSQSGTLCLDINNCGYAKENGVISSINGTTGNITLGEGLALQGSILSASLASTQTTLLQQTVNGLDGKISIQGTSDQIEVGTDGSDITLSTPQNISPTSSVTFAAASITGNAAVAGKLTGRKLLISPTTNSTDTFVVQDADANQLLTVDTASNFIRTTQLRPKDVGVLQVGSVTPGTSTTTVVPSSIYYDTNNVKWSVIGNDGFTRFVYSDWNTTNNDVHYVRCTNQDCSQSINQLIESDPNQDTTPSIALDSQGNAYITYLMYTSPVVVRVAHCLDQNCSSTTRQDIGSIPQYAYFNAVTTDNNGLPNIIFDTYDYVGLQTLEYIHCTNTDCSTYQQSSIASNNQSLYYQIVDIEQGSDGYARIVYSDTSNQKIEYVRCTNADCSTKTTKTLVNSIISYHVALALDSYGNPAVAYTSLGGSANMLQYLYCADADCTSLQTTSLQTDGNLQGTDLVFDNTNKPLIAYTYIDPNSQYYLMQIVCQDSLCQNFSSTQAYTPTSNGTLNQVTINKTSQNLPQVAIVDNNSGQSIKIVSYNTQLGADIVVQSSYSAGTDIGTANEPYGQIYARNLNLQTASSTAALIVNQQGVNNQAAGPLASFQINGIEKVGIDENGTLVLNNGIRVNGTLQMTSNLSVYTESSYMCDSCTFGDQVSSIGIARPSDIKIVGNTMVVSNGASTSAPTLSLYDITDPGHPKLLSTSPTNFSGGNLTVNGSYVYAPSVDPHNQTLIFDVTSPSNPRYVGVTPDIGWDVWDTKVSGNRMFNLARRALLAYDISNPSNPVYLGLIDTTAANGTNFGNTSLLLNGNTAYSVNGYGKICAINITNPAAMSIIGCLAVPTSSVSNGQQMYLNGNYIYLGGNSGAGNLNVIDISNPSNMQVVSTPTGSGVVSGSPYHIFTRGNNLIVGMGNGIEIYDMSDPANPSLVNYKKYDTGIYSIGSPVFSPNGKYFYVPDYSGSAIRVYGSNSVTTTDFQTVNTQNLTTQGDLIVRNNVSLNGALQGANSNGSYISFDKSTGSMIVNTRSQDKVGIAIRAATAQSANLQQWTDDLDNVLSSVSANGAFVTNGITNTFGKLAKPTGLAATANPGYAALGSTMPANATYYYVVTAINSAGETIASTQASVTTSATVGDVVNLHWNVVTGANSYKIYRSASSGSFTTPSLLASILATSNPVFYDYGSAVATGAPPASTAGSKLILQSWDAQSGNLQEWKDGNGNIIASMAVDKNLNSTGGQFTFANVDATTLSSSFAGTIFKAKDTANAQQINFQADGTGTVFNVLNQAGSAAGTLNFSFGYNNILARLTSAGVLQVNSTGTPGTVEKLRVNNPTTSDNTANTIITASAATSKPLVIQGAASQTANLQEWQTSAGSVLMRVTSTGTLQVNSTGTPGTVEKLRVNNPTTVDNAAVSVVSTGATTSKGLVIQGVGSQTANLQEWQSSAGTVLASISSAGNLSVVNATVNGTLTVNGHVITGNTSGTTSIAVAAGAGTGATASISGNDTSGVITVNTGTGTAAGNLATITFASSYGSAPKVLLTPKDVPAASTYPQFQYTSGTSTFTLMSYNALTVSKTYTFSYFIAQ